METVQVVKHPPGSDQGVPIGNGLDRRGSREAQGVLDLTFLQNPAGMVGPGEEKGQDQEETEYQSRLQPSFGDKTEKEQPQAQGGEDGGNIQIPEIEEDNEK